MRKKISEALWEAFMDPKAELVQRHDFLMRCSDTVEIDTNKISKNAGNPNMRLLAMGQMEAFREYYDHHLQHGMWATNEQLLDVPKVYGVRLRVFEKKGTQGALQIFSPLVRGIEKDESCQTVSMFCDDLHYEALIPVELYEHYCRAKQDKFCHPPPRERSHSRAKQYDHPPKRERSHSRAQQYEVYHRSSYPPKRERSDTDDDDPSQSEVARKKRLITQLEAFIRTTKADKDLDVEYRKDTLTECYEMLDKLATSP
jgi:hypothetical protein